MNTQTLKQENHRFEGTGGVSQENKHCGFAPAFFDAATNTVYMSCFVDGCIAPIHLLDGLPSQLIVKRTHTGKVIAVNESIISGFANHGRFYTREQAAVLVTQS